MENLLLAWERFRRGKRAREDVMIFEHRLEDNLFEIQEGLISGSYHHEAYRRFIIHDPKQRTIHKATVKDRVVHQAIINVIEPLFEKRFIHDSFSSRIDKSTHAAVKRLRLFLRVASRNNTRTIYAVKCDVRKFFASVDHEILLRLLARRVHDPRLLALLAHLVESFFVTPGVGLPLGNVTSQLFANVYLHELDWHIKQRLRVQHYVRYCDDFVILASSREKALERAGEAGTFLRDCLKMELHPDKTRVRTWRQGIDFVGSVLLPHATILRPSTARRLIARVTRENASSYLGLCTHANAFTLARSIRNII